jgi:general secretion pathway protein G
MIAGRLNRRMKGRLKAGYSLLEILIVLALIALIVALVAPKLIGQLDKSKVVAAHVQIKSLKSALDTMHLDLGRYPTPEEGLGLLVHPPTDSSANWSGPYLSGDLPKDPWGHDYIYVPPANDNEEPKITTLGSDGKVGGTGNAADITE